MASKALRPIRIEGNDAFITLTKGYVAVIDAADIHLVNHRNWCVRINLRRDGSMGAIYAQARVDGRLVTMHSVIAGEIAQHEIDHRDGDGLNNRRANLRPASHGQNMCNSRTRTDNTSGFKGVCFDKRAGKWKAYIRSKGRLIDCGLHPSPQSAAEAYARASAKFHGEFGRVE